MGWWAIPGEPELMTGDAVLDSVRHFLRNFSRQFERDLSRKPTIEELRYTLNLAFKVDVDDDVLSKFEEMEVKQVNIATAKRKRRNIVAPGDIFAFKLDDGKFGFGRVVTKVSIGAVAEIFDYFSERPIFDHSMEERWIVPPIPIDSYSLLEVGDVGDWRIIESHPGFVPSKKLDGLRYVYGISPNALVVTDIYENESKTSVENACGVPKFFAYDDYDLKELLAAEISRRRGNNNSL